MTPVLPGCGSTEPKGTGFTTDVDGTRMSTSCQRGGGGPGRAESEARQSSGTPVRHAGPLSPRGGVGDLLFHFLPCCPSPLFAAQTVHRKQEMKDTLGLWHGRCPGDKSQPLMAFQLS